MAEGYRLVVCVRAIVRVVQGGCYMQLFTSFINSAGTSNPVGSPPPAKGLILAGQACPYNCTYVSKVCCLSASGIVYEAPTLRLGTVRAPNNTAICDPTTGEFQISGG